MMRLRNTGYRYRYRYRYRFEEVVTMVKQITIYIEINALYDVFNIFSIYCMWFVDFVST
jgi:hypothetical protein